MKKTLKCLSLVLVLSLCLGILPIPAYAYSSDSGDTIYWPPGQSLLDSGEDMEEAEQPAKEEAESDMALEVLESAGIWQFNTEDYVNPSAPITRAQAAAIIYRMVSGDVEGTQASDSAGSSPFTDVGSNHWANGYITYCVAQGIFDGSKDRFDPQGTVSNIEMAHMFLIALGYGDTVGFTAGDGWQDEVAEGAVALDFIDGTDSLDKPASRENVAQMAYQALFCPTVSSTADGIRPVTGEDGGNVTLGDPLGVPFYSAAYGVRQFAKEQQGSANIVRLNVTHQFQGKDTVNYNLSLPRSAAKSEAVDHVIAQVYPFWNEVGGTILPSAVQVGQDVVEFAQQHGAKLTVNAKEFSTTFDLNGVTTTDGLTLTTSAPPASLADISFSLDGANGPVRTIVEMREDIPAGKDAQLTDGAGTPVSGSRLTANLDGAYADVTLGSSPTALTVKVVDQAPQIKPIEDILKEYRGLETKVDQYNKEQDLKYARFNTLCFTIGVKLFVIRESFGNGTLRELKESITGRSGEEFKKAAAEAQKRYPELFTDFTDDTVLTGEQVVAILTVLKELRTDPAASPNVTENDACLAVPKHLVKIRKPTQWVIYPDGGESGTPASPWALGYYTMDENGFLVPVESTEGAWDFLFEFRNDGWYNVNHGENIKLESAPTPAG